MDTNMNLLNIGTRRELFVDHPLIDRLDSTHLKLHEPVSGGVVLRIDKPWEGPANGPMSVIAVGDRLLMHYRGWALREADDQNGFGCVGESRDGGATWTKPVIDHLKRSGLPENNIITTDDGEPHFACSCAPVRLAMLGCTSGNGHPYSWSAMFNGYDRDLMTRECPFAGIPVYLNKEPAETLTIAGAKVTHVCCTGDGGFTAEHVAKCAHIPNVVERPEDVIGHVDAVIVATDNGAEHVERARPFVEAGLPVFVDKPLADNPADLETFMAWVEAGKPIMSSSCMRYAKEFMPYRASTHELGALRFVSITTPKSWERYGIHALEAVYPILGPGFLSVRNTGTAERNVVHIKHRSGVDVTVVASADMYGAFGCLQLCGTAGHAQVAFNDTFYAFKTQLEAFIQYLRTGVRPFPFSDTVELMRLVIAGIESRENNGAEVAL